MADGDVLFDVRNSFVLSSFSQCVAEAQKLKLSDESLKLQRDSYVYRSYLAQGKFSVIKSEIRADAAPELQAIKNAAVFLQTPSQRDSILSGIKKQQEDGSSMKNATVALMAALVYSQDQNFDDALRCLKQADDNLEALAAIVQIYLKYDRVDLAKKELKRMQDKDEDATASQLANAWVNLAMGGEKIQDAFYTFQELADKYGATAALLNSQAAAHVLRGKYEDAEKLLTQALDKSPNDADTLQNLATVSHLAGKGAEVVDRYINQLRDAKPDHAFLRSLAAKDEEFERHALQYMR